MQPLVQQTKTERNRARPYRDRIENEIKWKKQQQQQKIATFWIKS